MTLFAAIAIPQLPIVLAHCDEPALRDTPLVLVERHGGQVRVAAASDPRVAPGATLRQARLRLPDAQIRSLEPAAVQAAAMAVSTVLASLSPRVVIASGPPDLCLVADLGRASQARAMQWADQLLDTLWNEITLLPALGLAADPLTARLAAQVIPPGAAALILPGRAAAFLAPQPITLLPIAHELMDRLHAFGLRTIGQVAALPRDALQAQFGRDGALLAEYAQARHPAPFVPEPDTPGHTIGRRFAGPVADGTILRHAVRQLAGRLARRLDQAAAGVGRLILTVGLTDGLPIISRRSVIPATTDPARIAALLDGMLIQSPPPGLVEQLAITASELTVRPTGQLSLFPPDQPANVALPAVAARLDRLPALTLLRAVPDSGGSGCLERQVRLEPLA